MKTTPNLGLKKPEQTDFYNVDDFNDNADILDLAITNLEGQVSNPPADSINDEAIGSRTPDTSQSPTSPGTGTITQLVSWLANRIKAITGKPNWWDAPAKSIQELADDLIIHKAENASASVLGHVKQGTGVTISNGILSANVTSVAGKTGAITLVKGDVGLGSVENYGVATQTEAEAGTSAVKYMTPLRTRQAIQSIEGNAQKIKGIPIDLTNLEHDKVLKYDINVAKWVVDFTGAGSIYNLGTETVPIVAVGAANTGTQSKQADHLYLEVQNTYGRRVYVTNHTIDLTYTSAINIDWQVVVNNISQDTGAYFIIHDLKDGQTYNYKARRVQGQTRPRETVSLDVRNLVGYNYISIHAATGSFDSNSSVQIRVYRIWGV